MLTERDLLAMNRTELMELLCSGHPVDADELADAEYAGISLGLPQLVDRLTWKTFIKVFCRADGGLRGWNVRVLQGDAGAWRPRMRCGRPVTFGHYRVVPARGRAMPRPCDRGLLIDYGLGRNGRLHPLSLLRDPIVAVNSGRSDLLLGWTYLDFGPVQVETPSFFSLRRHGPLTHTAEPPH